MSGCCSPGSKESLRYNIGLTLKWNSTAGSLERFSELARQFSGKRLLGKTAVVRSVAEMWVCTSLLVISYVLIRGSDEPHFRIDDKEGLGPGFEV